MEVITASHSEITHEFRAAFENKRDNPDDKNDPYFKLYSEAALKELNDPEIQAEFVQVAKARPADTCAYLTNLLLRVIQQEQLVEQERLGGAAPKYPADYPTVDSWQELIRGSVIEHHGSYLDNMYRRDVQSNVDNRYVNAVILSSIYPERLGLAPTILDLGASQNHGLNRLARYQEFPFDDITVFDANFRNKLFVRQQVNKELTPLFNERLIPADFKPGPSRGIDIWPLRDKGNKLWVKACSNYPKEFEDEERQTRFDELGKEVEGVSFSQADCTDLVDLEESIPEKDKFDIVVLSTILYQLTDQERRLVINNAKRYARHFVTIWDSVDSMPNHPNRLKFPPHFYTKDRPFGYKTLVFDMQDPQKGFQELFRWENGRCKTVIPNLGNTALRAALRSS